MTDRDNSQRGCARWDDRSCRDRDGEISSGFLNCDNWSNRRCFYIFAIEVSKIDAVSIDIGLRAGVRDSSSLQAFAYAMGYIKVFYSLFNISWIIWSFAWCELC